MKLQSRKDPITNEKNSNIKLSYPIVEFYSFKINIQPSIYGAHLKKRGNETILVGADMVSLVYKAGQIDANEIANYERKIYEFFQK